MESIEKTFSDKGGNHLLVALYFYDADYKQNILHIPEEYSTIKIVDINITKAYVHLPINPIEDIVIGPEGYQTYGRAFYHEKQSSIIHIIVSYLEEKQQNYN